MTTSLKKQSNPSDFFLLGTLSIFSGSPCPMRCEDSSHLTEEPPDSSSAHLNIRTGRILQPQESRTPSHWKQTQETSFLEDTCHHYHPDRWGGSSKPRHLNGIIQVIYSLTSNMGMGNCWTAVGKDLVIRNRTLFEKAEGIEWCIESLGKSQGQKHEGKYGLF